MSKSPQSPSSHTSSLLTRNHITRYSCPCLLHLPLSQLRLQIPANASKRPRPQGQSRVDFGVDGTTFLNITSARQNSPSSKANFETFLAQERMSDEKHSNPLDRALSRITQYPGNMLFSAGKFALKTGLTYIIKRTTSIPAANGTLARDEGMYEIPCSVWRNMIPEGKMRHDCWWVRLHDLFAGTTDRAYWGARGTMDKNNISAPLVEW